MQHVWQVRDAEDWQNIGVTVIGVIALLLLLVVTVIGVTPVPDTPPVAIPPVLPQGTLAFAALDERALPQVFIANLDEGMVEPVPLTTNGPLIGLSWSATKTYLAVGMRNTQGDNLDIYTVRADGEHVARLTEHPANDYSPSWSPDGRRIVFTSTRDGQPELYVMNRDGTDQHRLTNDPAADRLPVWAPHANQVAFISDRDGVPNLYLFDMEHGEIKQLTQGIGTVEFPVWSPDGSALLVTANATGNSDIYRVMLDGPLIPVTQTPEDETNPAWSPDGDLIAFVRTINTQTSIVFRSLQYGTETVLEGTPAALCCLKW